MTARFHPAVLLALAGLILSPAALLPAALPDLAGHWEGAIDLPGTKLEVLLDFTKEADGTWKGDITIPLQNAKDLPLTDIKLEGGKAAFSIAGVPGAPAFAGMFGEDGKTIAGTFTQGGQAFPFRLAREADPVAKARKALAGIDELVAAGLAKLKVPGAAVAIVKDKEVVLAKGFGFRDVEQKLPMTPDTLLAIGSSSKAFTTFALGTLVDEGRVEWDKPLRNYIPWFRLYDAQAGERLTPRDLVTHRSGLPRHDLVWYNNASFSRERLVRSLAYLQPSADLRERFQYNNLMFLTAGFLVETITGKPWEDAVRGLVFGPLEMTRSNFSVDDSRKDADFASPYDERDGKMTKIPFRNITAIAPAGAINSSVNEMSHWVMVHLNGGLYRERRVVNAATVEEMHLAFMPTGAVPTRPDIAPADYGLGWFVDQYRGHRRVHHGGNIDGFSALVSFLPQDGWGFVVLTNRNGSALPELLVRTLTDRILGLEAVDWIGDQAKKIAQGEAAGKKAEEKKAVRRRPGTFPAHRLEEYAGDYSHPGYGDLKVMLQGKQLAFAYNGITTPLDHWHYETFNGGRAEDPTFSDMKLAFETDLDGNVASVAAPLEPTVDAIVFERKPEARLSDPAYLAGLAGVYDMPTQRVTVSLKGSTLVLSVPGQPPYDLAPRVGGEFSFKQIKVITVRFVADAQGKVTGLELNQPGGVYEAKRAEK